MNIRFEAASEHTRGAYTEAGSKPIKLVFRLRVWQGSTLLASSLLQSTTC